MAEFFSGALGPVDESDVVTLLGPTATILGVRSALMGIALDAPTYAVFYFSGHGNEVGLLCADGLLPYAQLVADLRAVNAPKSVVILDVCHAASYLDFLKEAHITRPAGQLALSWLDVLAHATPGSRLIFSAARDRNAGEGGKVTNGHFTWALLQALHGAPGDIARGTGRWVSDQRAFSIARQLVIEHFGILQQPIERGLTGDFPLAISQAETPIGGAAFVKVDVAVHGISVEVGLLVDGRKYVSTTMGCELVNGDGRQLSMHTDAVRPDSDSGFYSGTIRFALDQILQDPLCSLEWTMLRRVRVEWRLRLLDQHGRELDIKVVPVTYRPQ